jgi:hypothetical protein
MIEFLIRTVASHDWPAVHQTRLTQVLLPADSSWAAADGLGDFCMRLGDTEVSFSGEMVGWQVVFEGSIAEPDAQRTAEVVASQIQDEVGEPVEVVRLS